MGFDMILQYTTRYEASAIAQEVENIISYN